MEIQVDLPLAEVIYDFYDKLKSETQGCSALLIMIFSIIAQATWLNWIFLVNGQKVDAMSLMMPVKRRARIRALQVCDRLKEEIPKQMFKIAIQGAIGGTIIARCPTVSAFRKDVTAKCYGGDITQEKETPGKTEGRKKKDEDGGGRGNPPRRFRGGSEE